MIPSEADDEVVAAERALMDGLFSERGRSDPQAILRSSQVPGCRYAFVHEALHGPRFVAPAVPPSPDLMFQQVRRFMARLPPERHRIVRAHFPACSRHGASTDIANRSSRALRRSSTRCHPAGRSTWSRRLPGPYRSR
jgi:hypothetical protein